MKNLINLFDDQGWEAATDYPEGTFMKTLRDSDGARSILLKLAKGFKLGPHSHVITEQHLILEGSYTNDGITYTAGSYKLYNAHEEHGPFESEEGALVLVVWDPFIIR
ncbi:MAG: cupin domain-containing protein [Bacteroidales bacterium]